MLPLDLEITVRPNATGASVFLHMTDPESGADVEPLEGGSAPIDLDPAALRLLDREAIGGALTEALFVAPVRAAFAAARATARSAAEPRLLRVRLVIPPGAPALHDLPWETLRDPEDPARWLLRDESVAFSRWVPSADARPIRLRRRGELRALVVVASPLDPDDRWRLAPLDRDAEIARARGALDGVQVDALEGPATLPAIAARLRDGHDVLYLVCHGRLGKGEPQLLLEADDGSVARTPGEELARAISYLQDLPRLVVLASCESAGGVDGGALRATGPLLARAGVPAVIAMQGNVSIETAATLVPALFREIMRDGAVDRALAAARGAVATRPDAWMPALFVRSRTGRIWYAPGFGPAPKSGLDSLAALRERLSDGSCTPVLGPGLLEPLIGPWGDLARRLPEAGQEGLVDGRDDMARVAQLLDLHVNDDSYSRRRLVRCLRELLQGRLPDDAAPALREPGADVGGLLREAALRRAARGLPDAYGMLAALRLPVYLTADPTGALHEALRAVGRDPMVAVAPWREELRFSEHVYGERLPEKAGWERPLVYHLFGLADEPTSLVLTEDDHFDYLLGVAAHRDLIPRDVGYRMVSTALIFLGFRLDSWSFRVLFRMMKSLQGGARQARCPHVGVQLDPDDERVRDVARARRQLERYFAYNELNVTFYWGSAEDFLQELVPGGSR